MMIVILFSFSFSFLLQIKLPKENTDANCNWYSPSFIHISIVFLIPYIASPVKLAESKIEPADGKANHLLWPYPTYYAKEKKKENLTLRGTELYNKQVISVGESSPPTTYLGGHFLWSTEKAEEVCVVESGIIVVCKSFYPIFNSVLAVFASNYGPNVSCSIDFQLGSCSFPSNCGPNVSCSIDFQFGSCSFSSNVDPM